MAATTLQAFASALTDAARRPPPGLSGACDRRFAVYRNNVAVGLIRALEARFPALANLVGEDFFRAMARDFTRSHPPHSPVLMAYGDELPAFIATFAPAREMPYLADVARVEAAISRAYHAADAARAGRGMFSRLSADQLAMLRIVLHPAVMVVRSEHPVGRIHAVARGWVPQAPIENWTAEAVLIDRPGFDVVVRPIPLGTAAFLNQLARGDGLEAAATGAAADDPDFDLPAALAEMIGSGLATRIESPNGEMP